MNVSKEYNDLLDSAGISLAGLHINGIALKRNDALRAVQILRDSEVPILGGDVYFCRGTQIESAYANWYVVPEATEDHETYPNRSWEITETYIKRFPDSIGVESLFVIVTGN